MDLFRKLFHLPDIEGVTVESPGFCAADDRPGCLTEEPSASEAEWDHAKDALLRAIEEANVMNSTNERHLRGPEGAANVLRRARRNAGQSISERAS